MKSGLLAIAFFVAATFCSMAQTNANFTTLASFNGTNGQILAQMLWGSTEGTLTAADDGGFIGSTEEGGTNAMYGGHGGTLYRMTPEGALTTLYCFGAHSWWPTGHLVQGKDGSIYGTTIEGGDLGGGTIFRLAPNGEFTTICSFGDYGPNGSESTNGYSPHGLYQGMDGNFYGVTLFCGFSGGATIFRVTPTGKLDTLKIFTGRNSPHPYPPLLFDRNGDFYGTIGGQLFRVNKNGGFFTNFSYNGVTAPLPVAGLIQDKKGLIYGVGICGSKGGCILKIRSDGKFSSVVNLVSTNADFECPFGMLIEATDGNLYGMANSNRTVDGHVQNIGNFIRLKPDGRIDKVCDFMWGTPKNPLVEGKNGKIYGTTEALPHIQGLPIQNEGTVFCFTPEKN
jgi:uncharacterized repeat protein (TIGR03803 family)